MAARKKVKKKVTRRSPRVVSVAKRQTGRSNLKADKKRTALKPGKRISKTGNKYTETRKNRSDKDPKKKI